MGKHVQTTNASRANFLAYAAAITPHRLDGTRLKFNKGEFLSGKDGDVVPLGTKLVAVMPTLMIGWTKWRGGKPGPDHRMGYVFDGFKPPHRRDLDDFESDDWEVDKRGDRRDPWQFSSELAFINPATKAIFTFSTSSRGGLGALGELSNTYGKEAPAETYPLIELQAGSYQHDDRAIGRVRFPIFGATEFVAAEPWDAVLALSHGESVASPTEQPFGADVDTDYGVGHDPDDNIPF
jgi:hypothetical protein